jgi:ribokinase
VSAAGPEEAPAPAVVVVGSLHYDIMVEAPDRPRKGETLAGHHWAPKFGGKGGNQAVAARRHGAATAMVGAVGQDAFGTALLAGLDRARVDRTAVRILEGVGSGMSVAIIDHDGDYGAVIVSGSNLAIAAEQLDEAVLSRARVIILQNEIPEAVNEAVAGRARQHGVRTILNAAPARPFTTDLPRLVDILIVNAIEAEMLGGGGAIRSLADAATAAGRLAKQFPAVVVTAGGDGVAFSHGGSDVFTIPAIRVTVASTHGAGDAFVGTFAAGLASGAEIAAALNAANEAAARQVATPEDQR